MSKGRKPRLGRPPTFLDASEKAKRVETVLRCLPAGGGEIGSLELVAGIRAAESTSRASAIRWLKEAEREVPLKVRVDGRRRFYSFRITGFMEEGEARWHVRSSYVGFLDHAPDLWERYAASERTMGLFWDQSSSALVLGIQSLLQYAQSVTFGQTDQRVRPNADIARKQADVFVEVFLRKWIRELVAAYHHFLEVEQDRNKTVPRKANGTLGAPSARAGFDLGWKSLESRASKHWIASRTKGPWADWLQGQIAAEEARIKSLGSGAFRPAH